MDKWRKVGKQVGFLKSEVDPGVPPILQWIEVDQLVIDDRYQRPLERANWTAIRKIARDFSWSKFSPVFVAPVEGGLFAIIDGQHRTHAAAACGFKTVPCQIVQMSLTEQAASFAAVNGNVTKVTSWQVYKAALAAGEEWACKARDVAAAGGCKLMTRNGSTSRKKPGEIYGIKSFRKVVEAHEKEAVTSALRVLIHTESFSDFTDFWGARYLSPTLHSLCKRPRLFKLDGFEFKLAEMDLWSFDAEIAAENRERQREGIPSPAIFVAMEKRIGDWLDLNFPKPLALPAQGRAA